MGKPELKIPLTTTDKIIEIISVVFVFGIWALTLWNYADLPETIPTHYGIGGKADAFGNKQSIFMLPIVATIMYVLLSVLSKYPHTFNYIVEITPENAEYQYKISTRMMRILKISIVCVFMFIVYNDIQNGKGNMDGLSVWFFPMTMLLIFAPIFYALIKSSRDKG
ncbi:MAG: hypothetical protein CSA94_02085 [Bacteroidetes bacterium]|nr:MAG: hypothetical protein CSA94_02085 [Bacteroidota bacterium]